MKKTVFFLLLCITLALCSCARPSDSEETPSEKTTDATDLDGVRGKFGVYTDYSGLTPYKADWEVKSYYFDEPLSEIVPDDGYGALLPYVGEVLYDADGEVMRYKYGLCTARGEIITKPVYSEVSELYYSGYANHGFSGMISISKTTVDGNTKYAVAAADGSWITDFIYSYAYCSGEFVEAYCLEENYYVILDSDGKKVYPIAAGDYILSISDGYALAQSSQDYTCYFIDISGETVLGPFEDATGFSEGVAAVKDESGWRYIDVNGKTVLDIGSEYSYCWEFNNGYAALRIDEEDGASTGAGAIIDRDGNVLFDRELSYMGNGIWCDYFSDPPSYYDADAGFKQVTYNGSGDIQYTGMGRYFYKKEDRGVTLFEGGSDNGVFVEVEGEANLYSWMDDDILCVNSYTGDRSHFGIIDLEGNFLVPLSTDYDSFVKRENDGTVIFVNNKELKKSDGTVIMKNCVSADSFEGTDYIQVQDSYSSGYITTDGEWILRVSLLNSLPD